MLERRKPTSSNHRWLPVPRIALAVSVALALAGAGQAWGQQGLSTLATRLVSLSAVTGYEHAAIDTVLRLFPDARRDRFGNARIELGGGKARRLLVCPLDEPGYVVGNLQEDGYVTLRRVPGRVSRLFDLHCPRPGELTFAKDPAHFQRVLQARIDAHSEGYRMLG